MAPFCENCHLNAGQFAFDLSGEPGRTVVVGANRNLADWSPIATNVQGSGPIPFTDPQSIQPLFPPADAVTI